MRTPTGITRYRMAAGALLSFVVVSTLWAQTKKTGGPRLEIEPSEYDFGNVQQDRKLSHEFMVRNTGTEELEIRRISTSCGCTAALTAERVVVPGGSTTLQVTLETRSYKGVVERSVSLATNDSRRVHTVRIKAFVEAKEP